MASQAQLENQLRALNRTIVELELRLSSSRLSTSPEQLRALQQVINQAKASKTLIQQQIEALSVAAPYTNPPPSARPTTRESEASLLNRLSQVNKRILEIENQLKGIPEPTRQQRLRLQSALETLELEKTTILIDLATTNTGDEYNRLIRRPPRPVTQATNAVPTQSTTGLAGQVTATRKQATARQDFQTKINEDWRFKIYLAPESNYLYNDPNNLLLQPLNGVGVIFPYNPTVQVSYVANYDQQNITHSNFKLYFYKDSAVENISITGEFTAQNTEEANYLLAVIHFFKSATKMFYGQDQNPVNGTPPPICYIDGFGTYQFNKHPVLINNFSYSLPNDVDYIRASYPPPLIPFSNQYPEKLNERSVYSKDRLIGLQKGGIERPPQFVRQDSGIPTYVPTKIQITLTAYPVISRRDVSSNFSVKEYANGNLLLGRDNPNIGAGIW